MYLAGRKKSKSKQKLKSAILAIFQRGLGWPFPFSYGPQNKKMMIKFDKFFLILIDMKIYGYLKAESEMVYFWGDTI